MILAPALPPAGSRPLDFLAVGEASLDTICLAETFPVPDSKQRALGIGQFPGGQAATAAVGVARLGFQAGFAGAIGDDEAGRQVAETLAGAGVASHAVVRRGVPTRTAIVLVDAETGGRAVIESRDRRLDLGPADVSDELLRSARIVLVDASDIALAIRAASVARASGARTIVDIDIPRARAVELLNYIDVVIAPGAFFTELTGVRELSRALPELAGSLPEAFAVIATLGQEGVLAWSHGSLRAVRAEQVRPVDTTGAGDAYRAGFAAGWLRAADAQPESAGAGVTPLQTGRELEYLLRLAATSAALNCRAVGAQTALPTRAELFGSGPGPRV
jgi:sugar/nucleoside kinase (ribokinase family)